MWGWLKGLVGGEAVESAAPLPATMLPQAANDTAAEEAPVDLVESANRVLAATMNRLPVARLAPNGQRLSSIMPIASVELGGMKQETHSGLLIRGGSTPNLAQLTVTLRDKVGNYDIDSLNNAIHAVLGAVPSLAGHVKFAKDVKELSKTHADLWQELAPVVQASGKFTDHEIQQLSSFFLEDPKANQADGRWMQPIRVDHGEGKLQVRIQPKPATEQEADIKSSDAQIMEYFNTNKATIMASFKAKLVEQAGVEASALEHLDFDIDMKKGDYRNDMVMEIGSRDAYGKLQKTVLEGIDTEKLSDVLKESIFEGKELPSVFGNLAHGDSIAHLLRHRIGANDEALEKALDHDMFKNSKERRDEYKAEQKADIAEIANAVEGDEPHTLKLSVPLPAGVDLAALRTSIVGAQQQLLLAAQQQQSVGLAA